MSFDILMPGFQTLGPLAQVNDRNLLITDRVSNDDDRTRGNSFLAIFHCTTSSRRRELIFSRLKMFIYSYVSMYR